MNLSKSFLFYLNLCIKHDYRIRRDAQRFVSHTNDILSSTDPSNTSTQIIDIPKELCEVYERKEIGQLVTLTGK